MNSSATWTLTGHTRIVGVIGWPIEHSVSPPMHNAAFRALDLDWCYVPFPVHPERVREALMGARALGLKGLNATIPHKQTLLSLMDELTPEARIIGAVNTVILRDERMIGHNTDAAGFLRALREAGFAPEGCFALVLGAGGAARAVVYALCGVGAQVMILNRTVSRACALADAFSQMIANARLAADALDRETLARVSQQVQLIVNTTPLGMWPQMDASPWPSEIAFPRQAFLFDLIYNPRETRLMRQARAAGAEAIDGLGMLVHQGAEAFYLWTGVQPPTDVMYKACLEALGGG